MAGDGTQTPLEAIEPSLNKANPDKSYQTSENPIQKLLREAKERREKTQEIRGKISGISVNSGNQPAPLSKKP